MRELKPCRFCCGNAKLHIRELRFIGQNDIGDIKLRIGVQAICNSCKARGPLYSGNAIKILGAYEHGAALTWMEESATNGWNRAWENDNDKRRGGLSQEGPDR